MVIGVGEQNVNILIIEDEPVSLQLLSSQLRREPCFHVDTAVTLKAAREIIEETPPDVILSDLNLPDSEGLDTLRALLQQCELPIVVLTSNDDAEIINEALRQGAQDYIVKGQDGARAIIRSLRYAIMRHDHHMQLANSEERFRHYAEATADWFWETDRELRFTWASERLIAALGGESPERHRHATAGFLCRGK